MSDCGNFSTYNGLSVTILLIKNSEKNAGSVLLRRYQLRLRRIHRSFHSEIPENFSFLFTSKSIHFSSSKELEAGPFSKKELMIL